MITYKIQMVSFINKDNIQEYETQILPNVKDIIYISESAQYVVMQRKFKVNNSNEVILICDKKLDLKRY